MHVNQLKQYEREAAAVAAIRDDPDEMPEQTVIHGCGTDDSALDGHQRHVNSQAIDSLSERLSHLEEAQRGEILQSLR